MQAEIAIIMCAVMSFIVSGTSVMDCINSDDFIAQGRVPAHMHQYPRYLC